MTEKKQRFSIEQTTITECILDNTTGEQLDTSDYIERLCEVLNAFAEESEKLHQEINKLTDLIASEIEKNARLLQEINSLKIEDMRLKESIKDLNDILARYEEKELKE